MVTQTQRFMSTGQKYRCLDGPFVGESLYLIDPRTLTFSVRNEQGFYAFRGGNVNGLSWHPVGASPFRSLDGSVRRAMLRQV